MNRYFLFAGENHYPCGGMEDFIGHYTTMVEALQNIGDHQWFNVLDTKTGEVSYDYKIGRKTNLSEWARDYDETNG
jgi:hypothetical protein